MQNENIKIKSAEIKDELFCTYRHSIEVAKNISNDVTTKSKLPVHDDMKSAFRRLNGHLAVICEEVPASDIKDIDKVLCRPEGTSPEDYEKSLKGLDKKLYAFVVTGISFEGTGENEGVVLTGKKKLSTGAWLMLTAPKITWEDNYDFMNELRISADDIKHEVEEYMNGKQAPKIEQGDLFEVGFELGEEEETTTSEAKRRGRKSKETEQA